MRPNNTVFIQSLSHRNNISQHNKQAVMLDSTTMLFGAHATAGSLYTSFSGKFWYDLLRIQ